MAVKASDNFKVYENPNGPKVSTVTRKIIEKDGLYFKDIDGTGEVSKVNDWRLPAAERAKAYAEMMTAEEKIGQLFISDWRMGKYVPKLQPTDYLNQLQAVAEECEHFVPVSVASNLLMLG